MIKSVFIAHLLLICTFNSSFANDSAFSKEKLEKITEKFKMEIVQGNMPGAVILIAKNNNIIYHDAIGYLNKEKSIPMQKDAIFRAFSMTKPLVSVLTLIMMEEGLLQLADPIDKYLPTLNNYFLYDAQNKNNKKKISKPITIYDLLRHTSGITYAEISPELKEVYEKANLYSKTIPFNSMKISPEKQIEGFSKIPLLFEPGTQWQYGLSTDLLGRVLEAIDKKSLALILKERLLDELEMSDTTFLISQKNHSRIAEPLKIDNKTGKPTIQLIDLTKKLANDSGGAGIATTSRDYYNFCSMLLNNGIFKDKTIISRSSVKLMTSDHLNFQVKQKIQPGELLFGSKGYTFGLGVMVRKDNGFALVPGSKGEFSWAGYAGTFFWVDPQEELIGILMAQTPGKIRQYYRRLIKQMTYQALK